jgi:sugar O-acyltransferase (sialic acid O-acetyltransferase NeuD family)
MIFYGASGHALVVIDAWLQSGGSVTAILDDDERKKRLSDFPVEHALLYHQYKGHLFFISVGSNAVRKKLADLITGPFGKVVHPFTSISPSVIIEEGSVIMAGCVINANAKIGKHVILNTSCSVDHDCIIDDFVHISPGVTLCGGIEIQEGTHVGAGATILPNLTIGKWVTIGAGCVVTKSVPDGATVIGVPGKVQGHKTMTI